MNQRWGALGRLPTGDPSSRSRAARPPQIVGIQEQLAGLQGKPITDARRRSLPGGTASPDRSRALAEMLDRGLPMRVVAMDANGGYDTHENQAATLTATSSRSRARSPPSRPTSRAARHAADRVLVHVWSEFGRRPAENGSGTDHGAGGATLLWARTPKGMDGEFPGLTTLDGREPAPHGLPRGLQDAAGGLAGRRPRRRAAQAAQFTNLGLIKA